MTRTMADRTSVVGLPPGLPLYAGYDDGRYNDAAAIAAAHPGATVARITVDVSDAIGQVLDVENGDATPGEAPAWCERVRARGAIPTVYCSASAWPGVRDAFTNAGVPEPEWWIADYQASPDAPPPIPAGAVALQFWNGPLYDLSTVADYWPGVDATPPPAPSSDAPTTEPFPMDNETFVRWCYLTFLLREPDAEGWENWLGYLTGGGSREQLIADLVDSDEGRLVLNAKRHALGLSPIPAPAT